MFQRIDDNAQNLTGELESVLFRFKSSGSSRNEKIVKLRIQQRSSSIDLIKQIKGLVTQRLGQ